VIRPRITLLALSLAACLPGSPGMAAPIPDRIVESVRQRAEDAHFDGAILIGEPGGSVRIIVTGVDPVAPDAVWRWASITKQIAAVLAMQEVAQGRLDPDAPVSRYWPEWKAPQAAHIRIRDLLMHKSGLPQPDASPGDADGVPAFYRAAGASPEDSANGFCAGPPRATPPADYDYNNCDSIVLGEILHRITGQPFEQLARERIGKRLHLAHFGLFRFGAPIEKHVQPNGEFSREDALLNLGIYGAAGGAYGTIEDLWRFDHALLSGELIPESERELMWQSSRDNGFYGFFQWIFPATLAGCGREMRLVERQGLVGGIELRNYLIPETGQAVILFSRHRPSDFGDPWEGKGFAYDVLSKIVCP